VTVGSRRDQLDMVRAIDATGIRPVIDSHYPLERLADGFRRLQARQHCGKICIDI
jgi:NADPH:quinone reductase-like Zn-dependent oxidoreductase